MAKHQDRFVIRNSKGMHFTEMASVETVPVVHNDILVGHNETWRPQFKSGEVLGGAQFDTEADAQLVMNDKKYGGPASFAGCIVVISE